MITKLYTSIIQSLEQKKLMILSKLNILSSGKLASRIRSVDWHKVLVPAWKLETITSYLYQKLNYQGEEISHMPTQYVTISPANMTPIISD